MIDWTRMYSISNQINKTEENWLWQQNKINKTFFPFRWTMKVQVCKLQSYCNYASQENAFWKPVNYCLFGNDYKNWNASNLCCCWFSAEISCSDSAMTLNDSEGKGQIPVYILPLCWCFINLNASPIFEFSICEYVSIKGRGISLFPFYNKRYTDEFIQLILSMHETTTMMKLFHTPIRLWINSKHFIPCARSMAKMLSKH